MSFFDDAVLAVGWTEWPPVGRIYLAAGPAGVMAVTMGPFGEAHALGLFWDMFERTVIVDQRATSDAIRQLEHYFRGELRRFSVPLDLHQATPFQQVVFEYVRRIPAGHTVAYREVAEDLGDPRRAHAVGQALAANPAPVLVPCHRVIGRDGRLVGYSNYGGVETKAALLRHEGALLI